MCLECFMLTVLPWNYRVLGQNLVTLINTIFNLVLNRHLAVRCSSVYNKKIIKTVSSKTQK